MTRVIFPSKKTVSPARVVAVAVTTGCAALGLAGHAAADTTEDQLTGGRFCSTTTPFTCDPTHLNLTVPPDASAVQLGFTPNPNPCGGDLTVNVYEGGKAYPLGQRVDAAPGVHNVTVIPTCGQAMDSWGGTVHVTYIAGGGAAGAGHKVLSDVRLFDKPNGADQGVDLKAGDSVTLNGPCPIHNANNEDGANGWCVVTDTTKNLSGAVWGDAISK
jgi:hypothetical protein